jgi:ectoine hydroxylase-related dioxygenase (phytanoyl-CoA dioxygenase family)
VVDTNVRPISAAGLYRALTERERTSNALAPDTSDFAVKTFRRSGLVALGNVLGDDVIGMLRRAAIAVFSDFQARFETAGGTGHERAWRRGAGRFDIALAADLPTLDDPALDAHPLWMPLVKALLGAKAVLFHKGLVIAEPGAAEQRSHADGAPLFSEAPLLPLPAHALNLFVPLGDLTEDGGPTVFFPGSHLAERQDESVSAVVPAGSIILCDYRIFHYGAANRSDEDRRLLYFVYARPWFRDHRSFARERLADVRAVRLPNSHEQYPR